MKKLKQDLVQVRIRVERDWVQVTRAL